ncbi:MAG: hypothetical protein H0V53_00585 [Rubrobacter sp.]|jgi:hypothetical protein|nr:hypothetical protein [Rubrobacter sp.]
MDLNLRLPDEVVEALGPEPEREALEGVLLLLVGEGRMTLERAGEVLGLEGREKAARWYTERTLPRPEPGVEDLIENEEPVFLENLTQEDLDRLDRFLDIPPAEKGSGLSDVSINHDKYLYGDAS